LPSAARIQSSLLDNLDVPALDVAEDAGGPAARVLASLIALW
jgi:hypothetical protein